MNLKSCTTKSKNVQHYTPHKLRSHPLRCITFPVCIVFLFILFWFIICPLIFVGLWKSENTWPKDWPFYYWIVALLVFIILLSILFCVWKCGKQNNLSRSEADSLLNPPNNKDFKQNLYRISLNTIQKSQEKLDFTPVDTMKKQQNCAVNIPSLEEKLLKKVANKDSASESKGDTVFRRCSIVPNLEKKNIDCVSLPVVSETSAEVHSPSSPLTPRELFFWDLIENANRCRNSGCYDFIKHEKEYCSYDNCATPTCEGVQLREPRNMKLSSTEYFIANVPDRKSLTAEIFLYVDGGQQGKRLTIRTNQDIDDDDVFTN